MFKFFLIIIFTFSSIKAHSQFIINGYITDQNKKPLSLVIVSLQKNGVKVSSEITDSLGSYKFNNLTQGSYTIRIKSMSFQDTVLNLILNQDTIVNVQLRSTQILQEVVVRAQKPIFQQEIDRFRFNVGQTDMAYGSNIWDILEKTPLVRAAEDGSLSISGTSGAVVYINNRRKILSGNALKSYLSSLPSENLDAIEVITTPSSRYEAEGGAGIINIVTLKNKEEGLIGNMSLSTRQTLVNSQAGSLYLNERSNKWNLYTSIYMGNRSRNPNTNRNIINSEGSVNDINQRIISSINKYSELYPGGNFGLDYQYNKNHVVGLLLDFSNTNRNESRNALSEDFYFNTDSLTQTFNKDRVTSETYSLNLNYQGKLDSLGKILTIDYDVVKYLSTNNSNSNNVYLNILTGEPINDVRIFRTSSPQKINNQSVKTDFDFPLLNKKGVFSIGGKTSFSEISNIFTFENLVGGTDYIVDASQSNQFKYDENINSLYSNFNYKINPTWSYQVGLRLENTNAKGWLNNNLVVSRVYLNLFPTAFLKLTTKNKKSFVLAVTSRITRPGYWDLNPFRTFTTSKAYFTGNPLLQPIKYYREELSHTLNNKWGTLTLQLSASQTLNEIYALPYTIGDTIVNKKTNYGNRYGNSITASYNNQPKPWWNCTGTFLLGYVVTKGTYADDITINNKTVAVTFATNQTFTLSKKGGLSSTVIVTNSFPATIVNTRIGNRLDTELRLRKTAGKFNITLSAQDLFKSNLDKYNYTLGTLDVRDNYYNDTRSAALALSYSFGKKTVKSKRDRDTGSQDVKSRLR